MDVCASHHGETVTECYVQMFGIFQISFLQQLITIYSVCYMKFLVNTCK